MWIVASHCFLFGFQFRCVLLMYLCILVVFNRTMGMDTQIHSHFIWNLEFSILFHTSAQHVFWLRAICLHIHDMRIGWSWKEKHVLNTSKTIVISVTYLLLNTHVRIFVDKMNILVDTLMNAHKLCYLLGYHNLNILSYDTHDTITEFIGILCFHTILPLTNCPTRVTHKLW